MFTTYRRCQPISHTTRATMTTQDPDRLTQQRRFPADGSELRREIAYLEARLQEMGLAGDCAYERSLVRALGARLQQRRAELARLDH